MPTALESTAWPNREYAAGRVDLPLEVEKALLRAYLQFRAGILLQGFARLMFDRRRFRRPVVAAALTGAFVMESAWLIKRARHSPLIQDHLAVYADVAFTASAQVVGALSIDPIVSASEETFFDYLSIWAAVGVGSWIPDRRIGIGLTGGLCALSCMHIDRSLDVSRSRVARQVSTYAAFYTVGVGFLALVRRYVRLAVTAEADAIQSAGEAARASTRSELHRTMHTGTLGVLQELRRRGLGSDLARGLAMAEALRLRRALNDTDFQSAPTSWMHELQDEFAAAGLRLELVDDSSADIDIQLAVAVRELLTFAFKRAAEAGIASAIVRVAHNDTDTIITTRTRAPFLETGAELPGDVLQRLRELSCDAAHRSSRSYGTRLTITITKKQ